MAHNEPYYCSTLDSMFPPVIQNWVLCFPCNTSNVQLVADILRAGFIKTIQQRPFLAGKLAREEKPPKAGRLKLTNPDDGHIELGFSVNDLTCKPDVWSTSYEELRRQGMPIRQLRPEVLVPHGGYESLASSPIQARANFVPGGCLLDICLNHSFVDGLGGAMIVGAWAKYCKDLQNGTGSVTPSDLQELHLPIGDLETFHGPEGDLDQSGCKRVSIPLKLPGILQDSTAPRAEEAAKLQEDRTLWQLLGLQMPPVDLTAAQRPSSDRIMVSGVFTASSDSILSLKAESTPLNIEGDEEGAKAFVSSFDAIAALVWRSVLRARYSDLENREELHSRLRIPVNMRQILGIPHDYLGNVLLNSVTEIPLNELIAESTGRQVALKIRSSLVLSRDVSRALDALKLSFVLPDLSARLPLFRDIMKQDLVFTSWQDLPYYRHNWGPMFGPSGKADFFRLPHGYLKGVCALGPRKATSDEVEIIINMEQGQMDRLRNDAEFTQYFDLKAL